MHGMVLHVVITEQHSSCVSYMISIAIVYIKECLQVRLAREGNRKSSYCSELISMFMEFTLLLHYCVVNKTNINPDINIAI